MQELKQARGSLEKRRQALLQRSQHLDGEILECQTSLEDCTSQCRALMERTSAIQEKLIVQTKQRKASLPLKRANKSNTFVHHQELHYANLWIRTGTACGAVFHILRWDT